MAKKILKSLALTMIENNLNKYFNTTLAKAKHEQIFKAIAAAVLDELFEIRMRQKRINAPRSKSPKLAKTLHYLTIEFLPGKTLQNALFNLEWENVFTAALAQKGIDINKVYEIESDAGLGNGGLGRLAACFMDSLATLNYPATAHCIKYEYGFFKQRIIDNQQVEVLDNWLENGTVWLTARPDESVTVRFGGEVKWTEGKDGILKFEYEGAREVEAVPYDMLLSGFNSKVVSILRLWSAKHKTRGDIQLSPAAYADHIRDSQEIENINSVLYPSGDFAGQVLRLRQQYFLCSASVQNIVNTCIHKGYDLKRIHEYISIHINDTHPTMAIPELMRILMDEHRFSWDDAWKIVTKCVSYTNHTIAREALEVWESESIMRIVPRIYQIICEIDRRFRAERGFNEEIAIVKYNQIHMANLAVYTCHTVNGVAQIHSSIIKNKLFKKFADLNPKKFINITNGVTHRRWMIESNPKLAELITYLIGNKYYTEAQGLGELIKYKDDAVILKKINQIKLDNKKAFAKWLEETQGVVINPESRFDVHIKRIHEYKRQLLNVMRIIHIYNTLRADPNADIVPQTFIFAGKAASNYYMAKRIIKLINQLAAQIDKDETISRIIKVVFVENFSVTVSEKLLPAIDVSQQISLAGWEASGTGNMKSVMNGALMMCTYDGANAEIAKQCGGGGEFMFGLSPQEVEQVWADGYKPIDIYNQSRRIRGVIEALNNGFNGESFKDIAGYLMCSSHYNDGYMCLADFIGYLVAHDEMDKLYREPPKWAKAVLRNISNMGYFSSDRAIEEYVEKVWQISKLK
jgi:starch phosphorylase